MESMKTIHIERIYRYGDNEHYHIDLPDEFKLYEFDFLSDKQKHYASVESYNKELYKKLRNLFGIDAYKMGKYMLVLFWNQPMGMYVHTREFVSNDITKFNNELSNVLKQYVLAKYVKPRMDGEIINKFFNPNITDEERAECIKYIEQIKKDGDILTSVSKVLEVDGDYMKIASVYEHDVAGKPLNHISIDQITLYDFFTGVSTTYNDFYGKLVKDISIFEKAHDRFNNMLSGSVL
jgi:hypothetical protein